MESIFYFLDSTFWSRPTLVFVFFASVLGVLLLRYFGTAVIYQAILKIKFKSMMRARKSPQLRREILWSVTSSVVFTGLGLATFFLYQRGYTKIYADVAEFSIVYFFLSIPLFLLLYETYYYWLHRWMHLPSVFKVVHRVHHQSTEPTVFTSFAFHPLEAVLQFIFIPIAIIVFPIHYYALGIVLTIWTISAVVNHAGVEIFPRHFITHPIGKWIIGSTHHDLHHKEFRTNFGLYLTFWDKWMKTENENFRKKFEANKDISEIYPQH